MGADGLAELRVSARIYTCRSRGDTWQLIGEAEGMSKQSASSRLKTLEVQAERVAIIAAYSPPYLNLLLQTLVLRSGEVTSDADGNPAAPSQVQQDLLKHLRLAVEAIVGSEVV